MDQVLAKVKGNGKKKFFKLLSDQTLFDVSLQGMDFVEYNPDHNLDEDSWFKIPPRQNSCRLKFLEPFKFETKNDHPEKAVF